MLAPSQSFIDATMHFPSILPGETIYSWCATVHRKACSMSSTDISRTLFGKPNAARLHDFPCFLDEFSRRTGRLVGDPVDLARNHSLMGYFLSFTSEARSASLLDGVVNGSVPDIKMRLGIPASGIGGYHPLKCCQQCIERDTNTLGWPIWHLSHQFPSVLVCREHQRPLVLNWEAVTPVHRREWVKPSAELSAQRIEIPIADDQKLDLLLRLADFSVRASALHPGTMDSNRLARTYQRWAAENSALTPRTSIRHPVMINALTHSFDHISETLRAMGPVACELQLGSTINAVTRNRPKPAHPLKHLVLITCMFESWDAFWSTYMSESESQIRKEEIVTSRTDTPAKNELSVEFKRLVSEDNLSIRQAAIALGVSTNTGVRWAKIYGIDYTSRVRNLSVEYLNKVRKQLRFGKDKVDVIAATKITPVSLNRMLSSEPALRSQWQLAKKERHKNDNRKKFITAMNDHPDLPIWRLRKKLSTGWTWLYRHDRQWLLAAISAPRGAPGKGQS